MKRLVIGCVLLVAGLSMAFAGGAGARDGAFPSRDIRVLIPNAAGGGNDLTVRALIPGLERALGVSVVPVNQPAGRGAVAFHEAATARTDGYTLYFNSKTVLLMRYSGIEEAQIERLMPVAQVAEDVSIFSVRADSPHRTINDLINHIRTSPTRVRAGNSGIGALWHISQIMFGETIGSHNILSVAYAGSTPMLTALVAGEIEFATTGPEAITFFDAGTVRPLCVVFPTRYPSLPNIPTLYEETGLNYNFPVWRGFFTAAGTDPAVVATIADGLRSAVGSEEFQRFTAIGMIASFKGPGEFRQVVDNQVRELADMMPRIQAIIQAN